MSFKANVRGVSRFSGSSFLALSLFTLPLAAQQRGTVEFGAFGSAGRFDKSLTLDHGIGAGGHLGVYLDPRWAIEFEKAEMRASRTLGLRSVNVGLLDARLVASPVKAGRFSLMLGAGAGAGTETNFLHSYGVNALVGARIGLSQSVSLRIDGVADWLANNDWKGFQSVHFGLNFARNPRIRVETVVRTVEVPAPPMVQRPDSVSADEQARLRLADRNYRDLRDSLSRLSVAVIPPPSSASALATMEEKIHFATDKSDLTPDSRAILDAKVQVFRANPGMRIVIMGSTDERATDAYNMALGGRRSAAAKAYLIAQGIDPIRIESSSDGERNPTAAGTTTTAQALNRRAEFRLLIATDYPVPDKR